MVELVPMNFFTSEAGIEIKPAVFVQKRELFLNILPKNINMKNSVPVSTMQST